MRGRKQQAGSAAIEFVLTGIPLIFIWIGIFWMSYGMWQFHTLQYACKMANSYLAVHGSEYAAAAGGIKVSDVANVFAANAVGVAPTTVTLTLTAGNTTHSACRLDNCEGDSTQWPPTTDNTVGTDIKIQAAYTFKAPFAMWTPHNGPSSFSNSYSLAGYSHQQILF